MIITLDMQFWMWIFGGLGSLIIALLAYIFINLQNNVSLLRDMFIRLEDKIDSHDRNYEKKIDSILNAVRTDRDQMHTQLDAIKGEIAELWAKISALQTQLDFFT